MSESFRTAYGDEKLQHYMKDQRKGFVSTGFGELQKELFEARDCGSEICVDECNEIMWGTSFERGTM